MELIPAIDLRHGQVVRLRQGDEAQATVYSDEPVAVLESYADAGVTRVHVVDLDAALGEPPQRKLIGRMVREGVSIQLGGGLRDRETIGDALLSGCQRAVIGSLVARDIDTFLGYAEELSDWLIPALDVDTIYAVPISYHAEGMDREVLRHFDLPCDSPPDLRRWVFAPQVLYKRLVAVAQRHRANALLSRPHQQPAQRTVYY